MTRRPAQQNDGAVRLAQHGIRRPGLQNCRPRSGGDTGVATDDGMQHGRTTVDQTVVAGRRTRIGQSWQRQWANRRAARISHCRAWPDPLAPGSGWSSWRQAKKPNTQCYCSSCLLRGAQSGCVQSIARIANLSQASPGKAHVKLTVSKRATLVYLAVLGVPRAGSRAGRAGAQACGILKGRSPYGTPAAPPYRRFAVCLDLFRKSWERLARQLRKYRMD